MTGGKHENMKQWLPEEDQIILESIEKGGHQWSKIVQRLPGRTVSSVRNRWQRMEKGRTGMISKNRCHQCGQLKRGHTCIAKLKGGPHVRISPSGALQPSLVDLSFPSMPLCERLRAPSEPNIFIDSAVTRAVSPDALGSPDVLSVDVSVATPTAKSAVPASWSRDRIASSTLSRFAASELQSPRMRELYSKLFDSPRDAREPFLPRARPTERLHYHERIPAYEARYEARYEAACEARYEAAYDAAPGGGVGGEAQPPPLTRSLTDMIRDEMPDDADSAPADASPFFTPTPPAPIGGGSDATEPLPPFAPFGMADSAAELPLAPPPVVRNKSSGLKFTDLADIFGSSFSELPSFQSPMAAC